MAAFMSGSLNHSTDLFKNSDSFRSKIPLFAAQRRRAILLWCAFIFNGGAKADV